MLFKSIGHLNERASANGIDLAEYVQYPYHVVKEILIALEDGCSKHQINMTLSKYGANEFKQAVEKVKGIPDVEDYTGTLSCALTKYRGIDLRAECKKAELLLPSGNKSHSWHALGKGISVRDIQEYVSENEPEITELFIYLLAADHFMKNNSRLSFNESLCQIRRAITGNGYEEDDDPAPQGEVLEILAQYYAVSGLTAEEAISVCGMTARDLHFTPRETYRFMLETAAFLEAERGGLAAGIVFLNKNSPPLKYDFTETGFFRTRACATINHDSPLLIEASFDISKKGAKNSSKELFLREPSRNKILSYQVVSEAVFKSEGIWPLIKIPAETLQYVTEILSFFREEM